MAWPLSETLALIEPYLPAQLISPAVVGQLKQLAPRLPAGFFSYYLECRLDDSPQVDFLASVLAGAEQATWAEPQGPAGSNNPLLAEEAWRSIRHFFHHWAEPTTPLHQQSPMVWLEFDGVDRALSTAPLPGVCFCLDPDYVDKAPHEQQTSRLNSQRYQALTAPVLALLYERPLAPPVQRNLLACFDLLPASGRLIHISAMLGRQPAAVKVYAALACADLVPYLTRLGWPGSGAELGAILAEFYVDLPLLFVDLTIGETIAPRIGLAYSQVHLKSGAQPDARWTRLLDLWVARGYCIAEKRAGLLAWPGSSRQPWPGQAWPVRMKRWLDLKLVYQPGQPLTAKGYLGFMPTFSLF